MNSENDEKNVVFVRESRSIMNSPVHSDEEVRMPLLNSPSRRRSRYINSPGDNYSKDLIKLEEGRLPWDPQFPSGSHLFRELSRSPTFRRRQPHEDFQKEAPPDNMMSDSIRPVNRNELPQRHQNSRFDRVADAVERCLERNEPLCRGCCVWIVMYGGSATYDLAKRYIESKCKCGYVP